jgi:transglutaminase-like putative cysteine protease/glutamine cyclotransferase
MRSNRLVFFVTLVLLCAPAWTHPGKVIKALQAPYGYGTGLAYDGKYLWMADHKQDMLVCLNPADGSVVREVPSPGFWPMGLAWDGHYLWNADAHAKKIFKVDPKDGSILRTIDSPGGSPEALAWDGTTLWVSDLAERSIMRIDLSDGTALQTFPFPAQSAQGLAFDGTYLWCTDRLTDELYMMDPRNAEVIMILKTPGPYPRGLAFDGECLWNVDYQRDSLYRMVRQDSEFSRTENTKTYRMTFSHEAKVIGRGKLHELNVAVAVPVSLLQQEILRVTFSPAPARKVTDRWSQECAQFVYRDTPAGTTLSSVMVVEARISALHQYIFPERCGTLADIPAAVRQTYTVDDSKYQINAPFIQEMVKRVVGDEKNPYWIARRIFDTVRTRLEYKLEGGWNAAPFVLKRGTGSCSEYSFSFIALCRAAGLPARYVGSVVVRGDDASSDEVFHRWPEVYLPNYGWVPIDPQGGDKPLARDRAMNIGNLPNRFLITTQSGGGSEYLGWFYNSNEQYETDPQVRVEIEAFGEWEPIEETG